MAGISESTMSQNERAKFNSQTLMKGYYFYRNEIIFSEYFFETLKKKILNFQIAFSANL